MGRLAMIVKLQRHADDVIALGREQRGGDGRIDPARHRNHDAGVLRTAVETERIEHDDRGLGRTPWMTGVVAIPCPLVQADRRPRQSRHI